MNESFWNTFDAQRRLLNHQYQNVEFRPDTGFDISELQAAADKLINGSHDLPFIQLRARLLELVLTHGRIHVDPADWFADHLQTGGILCNLRDQRRAEVADLHPEMHRRCDENFHSGLSMSQLDTSHTSPDWNNVLDLGLKGIRQLALERQATAQDREAREFYQAVACVYDGMIVFVKRLADEAERCGAIRCQDTLRAIAEHAPATFQQALQLALLYHNIQEEEGEQVRSMGRFDQLYIRFYRHDLNSGILTREQAKELLKFFWTKFYAQTQGVQWGKNFTFGGMTVDGADACNELTILGVETYNELQTVDPKLSLRVHPNMNRHVLDLVAKALCHGNTSIVFANDEMAQKMLIKRGAESSDIERFIVIGCYEPSIMGKELCCSMGVLFNLAKVIELLLEEKETPQSFEVLYQKYLEILSEKLSDAMSLTREWESLWPEVNPSPLLSGTMSDCMNKGRDISRRALTYNPTGVMCAGLGTAADSLIALKKLLFDSPCTTWEDLRIILKNNWDKAEPLRNLVWEKFPKWGNNLSEIDTLAVQLSDAVSEFINHTPNGTGSFFQTGLWSIDWNMYFGNHTQATPDGRMAGTPLSKNLCATLAHDTRGVTALIHSASKLHHDAFCDGAVLDVMLHPSLVSGSDGYMVIEHLLLTYFKKGGLFIQFNILDADILKKAQKEPEKYSSIQIRVCGWNVRFIDLSVESQNIFIRDAEEKGC